MTDIKRIVSSILAIALVVLVAVGGCGRSNAQSLPVGVITGYSAGVRAAADMPALDFRFKMPDGQESSLSQLRGKIVFINFWRSDCPLCVDEMPLIQKAYHEWSGKGVQFLAINASEDEATAGAFLGKYGYTFPALLDKDSGLGYIYRAYYLPISFFIDEQGVIRGVKAGAFVDSAEIESGLSRLVSSSN